MRNSPADKLDVGDFVHPKTQEQYSVMRRFHRYLLLDVEREREEDPDGRTDDHREEQQDELQTVASPAQSAPPELVQVRLDLDMRVYSSGRQSPDEVLRPH